MVYKLFLSCICIFQLSLSSAMISDFSPIQVGNRWTYEYISYYDKPCGGHYSLDSLIITLEIDSICIQRNKATALFSVEEKGRSYNGWYSDTIEVNKHYLDSAFVMNDSIYRSIGWQCPVFPLWKSHTVPIDSLEKMQIESDTLWVFSLSRIYPSDVKYAADIGFYQENWKYCIGITGYGKSVNLKSFNNNPMLPLNAKTICKIASTNKKPSKIIIIEKRTNVRAGSTTLLGRRLTSPNAARQLLNLPINK